ncbi:MAG TPA: DJ-1/PfpI family protein, partial [Polyangiales bacterium]
MRQIALVVFDRLQPLDLAGPYEVFSTANAILQARGREAAYRLFVLSPGGTPVRGESGLGMMVDGKLEQPPAQLASRFDTLMVCGGFGTRQASLDRRITRAVAKLGARANRISSVCTGTFVLAAAGLLAGRRATTHWRHCEALA